MNFAPRFEEMLVDSGIKLFSTLAKKEQSRRLGEHRRDPLKQRKSSPVDAVALKHWDGYTWARDDEMFMRTHTAAAPWSVVLDDNKRVAKLNLIKDIRSCIMPARRTGYNSRTGDRLRVLAGLPGLRPTRTLTTRT